MKNGTQKCNKIKVICISVLIDSIQGDCAVNAPAFTLFPYVCILFDLLK